MFMHVQLHKRRAALMVLWLRLLCMMQSIQAVAALCKSWQLFMRMLCTVHAILAAPSVPTC
jgi:hypothetical protein